MGSLNPKGGRGREKDTPHHGQDQIPPGCWFGRPPCSELYVLKEKNPVLAPKGFQFKPGLFSLHGEEEGFDPGSPASLPGFPTLSQWSLFIGGREKRMLILPPP